MLETIKASDYRRIYYTPDIHGIFTELEGNLLTLGFDFKTDLLITTGDLIDRGFQSNLALHYLKLPWFKSTLGNHELMFIEDPHNQYFDKNKGLSAFKNLPLAIEVVFDNNFKIGFSHAAVPDSDWNTFKTNNLSTKQIIHTVWDRQAFKLMYKYSIPVPIVKNINYVFHGHNAIYNILKSNNTFYCDTGSCFRYHPFDDVNHAMTIIDIKLFKETLNVSAATKRYT
jgi:serine/threonine protein phosphatase 1